MKRVWKMDFSVITIATIIFCIIVACDGGGDGGRGGQPSGQTTTIRGNVETIVAMAPQNNMPTMRAKIKDFLTLSRRADAQDNQIVVTFIVDGEVVDVVTVKPDGDFEGVVPISISGNNVTLVFGSDGDEESVVIFVPPVDAVVIVVLVNFEGNEADVEDIEFEGPLRCENATISLVAEEREDIKIHGNGDACVLTAGNCDLSFDAENIIFHDCNRSFDARGNSVLRFSANGGILCEGAADCVISRGTSSAVLSASEIDLNCIDAQGNSEIVLNADSCSIGSIIEVGNATVDTSGCSNILN